MKRVYRRPLLIALSAVGISVLSMQAMAAGFQLWEQDGASVGNYHAGYAAQAADASTAFYNPAGITRFKNQQIVFAGVGVTTNIQYKGTTAVNMINNNEPIDTTVQGGVFGFIPALHYVTPINEISGFGFSVVAPFGMKMQYGRSSPLRYVSTLAEVAVADISPTFALKITDKASLGFGPDIQKMKGRFNQVGTIGGGMESDALNSANDTGYGYHAGLLYEFTPETRAGISYHSQVVHHLTGTSKFVGPLAEDDGLMGPVNPYSRAKLNLTLPPYTALSIYHQLNPQFAVMASAIYTQWSVIRNLVMQNVSGVNNQSERATDLTITIPQYYRNTWNFSVGANYHATEKIILRTGVGYDQAPVNNAYRNVQMPDNDRYVVALGGHYQSTKALGFDLGWMHLFMNKAHIAPPTQVTGIQTTTTSGSVTGSANVLSAQVVWDIE